MPVSSLLLCAICGNRDHATASRGRQRRPGRAHRPRRPFQARPQRARPGESVGLRQRSAGVGWPAHRVGDEHVEASPLGDDVSDGRLDRRRAARSSWTASPSPPGAATSVATSFAAWRSVLYVRATLAPSRERDGRRPSNARGAAGEEDNATAKLRVHQPSSTTAPVGTNSASRKSSIDVRLTPRRSTTGSASPANPSRLNSRTIAARSAPNWLSTTSSGTPS